MRPKQFWTSPLPYEHPLHRAVAEIWLPIVVTMTSQTMCAIPSVEESSRHASAERIEHQRLNSKYGKAALQIAGKVPIIL